MPENQRRPAHRRWVRRVLPAGVAAVLVIAGAVVTRANASGSPIDTYRTTTVTSGPVEQRLNLTGSVQRVNQASQSLAVVGTVSSVAVSLGDSVRAGQTLATVDPVPFRRAVTDAEATVARARATLASDQTSKTSTASGTSGSGTLVAPATAPSTGLAASSGSRSTPGTGKSLALAQAGAAKAQKAITDDLRRASAALLACTPVPPARPSSAVSKASTHPVAVPKATATPAPTTTGAPAGGGTPHVSRPVTQPVTGATAASTPSNAATAACLVARRAAPSPQQIRRDQLALAHSQADLSTAVNRAITAAGATSQSGSTTSSAAAGADQSSAARLVSDQAALAKAGDDLVSAQADVASATLRSSIAGTVGSVSLVPGASSAGRTVVIVGAGAVAVTVQVPQATMVAVHLGQQANVTPLGATSSVPGTVSSISLLPSTSTTGTATGTGAATGQATGTGQASTTSSSPAYPVKVLVAKALPSLASGSRAEVSLLVGRASHVLSVPSSALTPLGNGQALAFTFKNGVATRVLVKTGYTGALSTQVTSGLNAGQQVVLADLSTALPTNTTSSRRFGVGAGVSSGLGGAGLSGRTFPAGAR